MGNLGDFLLGVDPFTRAKRDALAKYQHLLATRGHAGAESGLNPLDRQLLGIPEPISSDANIAGIVGKLAPEYSQVEPSLLESLVRGTVGAPQTGPLPRQTGTSIPTGQLTNDPGGFTDVADLAAIGGGGHVPIDALGKTRKDTEAEQRALRNDVASTAALLMSAGGLSPDEAMSQAKVWHGATPVPGEKPHPNYHTLAQAAQLSASFDENTSQKQERLMRMQLLQAQTAEAYQKMANYTLANSDKVKSMLDILRALPKGADSDKARLGVISGLLRKMGITQEDIKADPSGFPGVLNWIFAPEDWKGLFGGTKGSKSEKIADNTEQLFSTLEPGTKTPDRSFQVPPIPGQGQAPQLPKAFQDVLDQAGYTKPPQAPEAAPIETGDTNFAPPPAARKPLTAEAMSGLQDAMNASFAGRPIPTATGLQRISPYDVLDEFKKLYELPPGFEEQVLQRLSEQTTKLGTPGGAQAAKTPLASLMQAMGTLGQVPSTVGNAIGGQISRETDTLKNTGESAALTLLRALLAGGAGGNRRLKETR